MFVICLGARFKGDCAFQVELEFRNVGFLFLPLVYVPRAKCAGHTSHPAVRGGGGGGGISYIGMVAGLCSSRAQWPLVPNVCSRAIRKSYSFHTNHNAGHPRFYIFGALGSLQFSLEHSLGAVWILSCLGLKSSEGQ